MWIYLGVPLENSVSAACAQACTAIITNINIIKVTAVWPPAETSPACITPSESSTGLRPAKCGHFHSFLGQMLWFLVLLKALQHLTG